MINENVSHASCNIFNSKTKTGTKLLEIYLSVLEEGLKYRIQYIFFTLVRKHLSNKSSTVKPARTELSLHVYFLHVASKTHLNKNHNFARLT